MFGHPMGALDGLSDADREARYYWYCSKASDVRRRVSVRGLARIIFGRRDLEVFSSGTDAATVSVLLADPRFTSGARRARLIHGLWPGSRRPVTGVGQGIDAGEDVNGEP